jgi:hypothetical protein
MPMREAKEMIPAIKTVLEQGNFPVKTQVGNVYGSMKTML